MDPAAGFFAVALADWKASKKKLREYLTDRWTELREGAGKQAAGRPVRTTVFETTKVFSAEESAPYNSGVPR
jgi:hypothetical protein